MSDDQFIRMSPDDVVAEIKLERAKFAENWAGLTPEQMVALPGPQDDWSVKDLMAHITWWEDYIVRMSEALTAGQTFSSVSDYDAKNAEILVSSQQRSLDDILNAFKAMGETVIATVERLSDTQLNDLMISEVPLLYKIMADTSGGEYSRSLMTTRISPLGAFLT